MNIDYGPEEEYEKELEELYDENHDDKKPDYEPQGPEELPTNDLEGQLIIYKRYWWGTFAKNKKQQCLRLKVRAQNNKNNHNDADPSGSNFIISNSKMQIEENKWKYANLKKQNFGFISQLEYKCNLPMLIKIYFQFQRKFRMDKVEILPTSQIHFLSPTQTYLNLHYDFFEENQLQ